MSFVIIFDDVANFYQANIIAEILELTSKLGIYMAVAGAECNTVTGLRREPRDAWPSARS